MRRQKGIQLGWVLAWVPDSGLNLMLFRSIDEPTTRVEVDVVVERVYLIYLN